MTAITLSAPFSPGTAPRKPISRVAWLLRLCGILVIGVLTPSDMFLEGGQTYAAELALSDGYRAADNQAEAPDPALMTPVPAERLLPLWRRYTDMFAPGEARFELAYRLDSELPSRREASGLWLEMPDGRLLPIGMDEAGYLTLPEAAHDRGIVTRQTRLFLEEHLNPPIVRLEVHPRLPLVQAYEIAALSEMAAEVDAFQRRSTGVMYLASPRWTELVFRFNNPAPDGWLVRANGTRVALTAIGDTLSLRLDGRVMSAGGRIELGEAPAQIILQAR